MAVNLLVVNTSFFHNACFERRRNIIGNLKNEEWSWVVNEKEKKMFITNAAFQVGSGGDEGQVQQILDVVQPRVTPYMNELLTTEFIVE